MSRLSGVKILVVDDEDLLREILRDILEYEGAEVFEAENGTKAFEALKNNSADVLLSDIRMPGGDGLTLLKRAHAELKPAPISFLYSAYADVSPQEASQLGARRMFSKPFDGAEIVAAIESAIAR